MKKVLTAAILAVTTCAFTGCTKNEVRSISDNPQAVRFLPLNGKHSTKAMINGTTYPKIPRSARSHTTFQAETGTPTWRMPLSTSL